MGGGQGGALYPALIYKFLPPEVQISISRLSTHLQGDGCFLGFKVPKLKAGLNEYLCCATGMLWVFSVTLKVRIFVITEA